MSNTIPLSRPSRVLTIERRPDDDDLDVKIVTGGLATLHGLMEGMQNAGAPPSEDFVRDVDWTGVADFVKALHLQFFTTTAFSRLTDAIGEADRLDREAREGFGAQRETAEAQ